LVEQQHHLRRIDRELKGLFLAGGRTTLAVARLSGAPRGVGIGAVARAVGSVRRATALVERAVVGAVGGAGQVDAAAFEVDVLIGDGDVTTSDGKPEESRD